MTHSLMPSGYWETRSAGRNRVQDRTTPEPTVPRVQGYRRRSRFLNRRAFDRVSLPAPGCEMRRVTHRACNLLGFVDIDFLDFARACHDVVPSVRFIDIQIAHMCALVNGFLWEKDRTGKRLPVLDATAKVPAPRTLTQRKPAQCNAGSHARRLPIAEAIGDRIRDVQQQRPGTTQADAAMREGRPGSWSIRINVVAGIDPNAAVVAGFHFNNRLAARDVRADLAGAQVDTIVMGDHVGVGGCILGHFGVSLSVLFRPVERTIAHICAAIKSFLQAENVPLMPFRIPYQFSRL